MNNRFVHSSLAATAGRRPLSAIGIILLLGGMVFRSQSVLTSSVPPLQNSSSFGDYTARAYFDPASNKKDPYFEILRNKKPVYRQQATENGEKFVIGTLYNDDPDSKLVTMGRDITGDGQPDLVVSEWAGGANCCLTLHIFEIGWKFRKISDLDAGFGDQGPHFVKLADGPGLQVQDENWSFGSPALKTGARRLGFISKRRTSKNPRATTSRLFPRFNQRGESPTCSSLLPIRTVPSRLKYLLITRWPRIALSSWRLRAIHGCGDRPLVQTGPVDLHALWSAGAGLQCALAD